MKWLKASKAVIGLATSVVLAAIAVVQFLGENEGPQGVDQLELGIGDVQGDTLDSVEVEKTETENCVVLDGSVSHSGNSKLPIPIGYTIKVVAGDTVFEGSGSGGSYEVSLSSRCIDTDAWIELIHPEYFQIGGPLHVELKLCKRYTNNFLIQAKTSLPKTRYARRLLDEAGAFESAGRPDLAIGRYVESWQVNPRARTCIAWVQVLKKLVMLNDDVSAELQGNLQRITSSKYFARTSNDFKSNFYSQLGDAVDQSELATYADSMTLPVRYSECALNAFDSAIHYYSVDANPWQGKYLLQMRLGQYKKALHTISEYFAVNSNKSSQPYVINGFMADWATCIEQVTHYSMSKSSETYAHSIRADTVHREYWEQLWTVFDGHVDLFQPAESPQDLRLLRIYARADSIIHMAQ